MRRYVEEPYRTPPGSVDAPFVYVYDAKSLTDGTSYNSVAKDIQGDSDFVLRAIRGVPTCMAAAPNGLFSYKNPNGTYCDAQYAFGGVAAVRGIVMPNNWPVVPEKIYRANTAIQFDLTDVLRAGTPCVSGGGTIYWSQIAFCGVKRFPVQQGYALGRTGYAYRPLRYSYNLSLNVNWGYWAAAASTQQAPAQRFTIGMEQYDFELMRIKICPASGAAGALTTPDFQVVIYDANMHQLSDHPVNQSYVNAGKVAPNQAAPYQAVFPIPTLVYPQASNITLDVYSLLCNADARLPAGVKYSLMFEGVWRVPVGDRYTAGGGY